MEHLNSRIIKNKLGLLNLAAELGNVSKACKVMGLSRDTFYRYQAAHEEGGVEALLDRPRRKPNLKNRTDEAGVAFVPCERAADVLQIARQIDAGDNKRKADIDKGTSVADLITRKYK